MEVINKYLEKISQNLKTGLSKEHTHRAALEFLFESFEKNIKAVNEPARTKVGAPDFAILKKNIPIGYVEAKDITAKILEKKENQAQIKKYFDGGLGDNFIFTDYITFIFYRNSQEVKKIQIAKIEDNKIISLTENFTEFENFLKNYLSYSGQTIKSTKKLSEMMAAKSRTIKSTIFEALKEDEKEELKTNLYSQFLTFKNLLIKDLDIEKFSDIYAQTIAYGLFAARLHDDTLETFSRLEAAEKLPQSNPFLKKIFTEIGATDFDERISWIIDDLVELFKATDVKSILKNYKKSDPLIHFYEDFLSDYDPALRKSRGVWYTPKEVVSFIVSSVDEVLEKDFNLVGGLTNIEKIPQKVETQGTRKGGDGKIYKNIEVPKVQILDPAVGTGTFLVETIKQIQEKISKTMPGNWKKYLEENLIDRINGFEILMASYAMAHMRLDILFQEYDIEFKKRFNIFLTNSLEKGEEENQNLFSTILAEESNLANKIKTKKPIFCVIGNPPYSAESKNQGKYIMDLIDVYKKEPEGKEKLKERNSKVINDDYVKFIRLSENFIEKNNEGVLGFITNHGYLDNPTFRGMRWHLLKTFDKIYIVDLHGNARKKEKTPEGNVDQNIFDIMAGVSIIIAVKNNSKKEKLGQIFHTDVWGKREVKNKFLLENNLSKIKWNKLENKAPYYFFVPKDFKDEEKYNQGFSVNKIFKEISIGIQTEKDDLVISGNKNYLINLIDDLKKLEINDLLKKYNSTKQKIELSKKDIENNNYKIIDILHRPFDIQQTIFTGYGNGLMGRPRTKITQHFLKGDNLSINFTRQGKNIYPQVSISKFMSSRDALTNHTQIAPLYLYQQNLEGKMEKIPNFDREILKKIEEKLDLKFNENKAKNSQSQFSAENLLDYIYAVLHSPKYREKFKEFLKIDFPKIPFQKKDFWKMVEFGKNLRELHLLKSPKVLENVPIFKGNGENIISKKIKFSENKVWINETQYFENVSEIAWNFFIGGYQPAQKYLKDRKEREITFEEIQNYQKIIRSLEETQKIMLEINKIFKI